MDPRVKPGDDEKKRYDKEKPAGSITCGFFL
jgi:hypothetical protein